MRGLQPKTLNSANFLVLLLGSSNKYSADNQSPIIYPGLAPHCILALAHYAFTAAINAFRLLADFQDKSVNRNNIYIPVLPEKRNDRTVPAPPIKLNRLRAVFKPTYHTVSQGTLLPSICNMHARFNCGLPGLVPNRSITCPTSEGNSAAVVKAF
jgi:hypothetical protein